MRAVSVSPADLRLLHLVLNGSSVIDWNGLAMDEPGQVERFLALNAYDITDPGDRRRLSGLVSRAKSYLQTELDFPLSPAIRQVTDLRQFFYMASGRQKNARQAMEACALLKVVHIINHLDGRHLLFHLSIGIDELYAIVKDHVMRGLERLKKAGIPVARFAGDTKGFASQVTKLLAKKETIAAEIQDRLRFRVVTQTRDEIVPVILGIFGGLLPFNYVIPGESANDMVDLPPLERHWPTPMTLARRTLQTGLKAAERRLGFERPPNVFSGPSYKIVQFVVDVPFHLGRAGIDLGVRAVKDFGPVVFTKVEFQVIDRKSEAVNNQGVNSHEQYKGRQRFAVLKRLVEA